MMRPTSDRAPVDVSADLQREIAELRSMCASLQKDLAVRTLPVQTAAAPLSERTVATEEQIAAAVEAALKRREAKAATNAGAVATTDDVFDVQKETAALVGTSYWNNAAAWTKASKAGKLNEVLAEIEKLAKANPNDPKAQMNLANAYLAALQLEPGDYSGAGRADQVLDRVLALDGQHWEARFTKAMSYTFWPEFTGKPKEAISHFETLVKQQETMPVTDDQAQTYLFLGNLLEKSDAAKAKEYWQKGARRHPNNEELRKKAGSASGSSAQ